MKKLIKVLGAISLVACMVVFGVAAKAPAENNENMLTVAVAWKQTAAEYKALYYQAFNVAKMHIDEAVAEHAEGDKPLCIITDVDDTIVLNNAYWGRLIADGSDFFDDALRDEMVPTNSCTAAPGALELLNYCEEKGVEVFYVTSRDQGEGTYDMALGNLQALDFPYADQEHLTVLIDTSNKEEPQNEIAEDYDVILKMGDNLNDFQRVYYVEDVEERAELMAADKELFGTEFIQHLAVDDGLQRVAYLAADIQVISGEVFLYTLKPGLAFRVVIFPVKGDAEQGGGGGIMLFAGVEFHRLHALKLAQTMLKLQRPVVCNICHHHLGGPEGGELLIHKVNAQSGFRVVRQVGGYIVTYLRPVSGKNTEYGCGGKKQKHHIPLIYYHRGQPLHKAAAFSGSHIPHHSSGSNSASAYLSQVYLSLIHISEPTRP